MRTTDERKAVVLWTLKLDGDITDPKEGNAITVLFSRIEERTGSLDSADKRNLRNVIVGLEKRNLIKVKRSGKKGDPGKEITLLESDLLPPNPFSESPVETIEEWDESPKVQDDTVNTEQGDSMPEEEPEQPDTYDDDSEVAPDPVDHVIDQARQLSIGDRTTLIAGIADSIKADTDGFKNWL